MRKSERSYASGYFLKTYQKSLINLIGLGVNMITARAEETGLYLIYLGVLLNRKRFQVVKTQMSSYINTFIEVQS